jgi:hypothetical protein
VNVRGFFIELKRRNAYKGRDRLCCRGVVAKSRLRLHHFSLNSPLCSCVSIRLPASGHPGSPNFVRGNTTRFASQSGGGGLGFEALAMELIILFYGRFSLARRD